MSETGNTFALQGLHHIAVQALDWDESLHLYQDILGMKLVAYIPVDRKIALLSAGNGCFVELFAPTGDVMSTEGKAPLFHVALRTDDAAAVIEKVRAAGYNVTREPGRLSGADFDATIAFFDGPAGELIELVQPHGDTPTR